MRPVHTLFKVSLLLCRHSRLRRYRHTPVLNVWENVQNRLLQSIYQSEEQKHRLTCIGKACVEIFDRLGDSDANEREAFDALGNIILLEQTMVTGVEWQVRTRYTRVL